jgi:hypothetical protein
MITKWPASERPRPLAHPLGAPHTRPSTCAGSRADVRAGAGRASARWAGGLAVAVWLAGAGQPAFDTSGDRVVSVALASPLAAAGGTDGSDDSGAGYGPSPSPMSVPHGSSSSSSGSGGVAKGTGSDSGSDGEDAGGGGILGWVKDLVGGASSAAGSGAGAGSRGGASSSEGDGGNLASTIMSKVFSGVSSVLSHFTPGGD